MLEKVELRSSQGSLLTLSLKDISNGYVINDIQGIDDVKAVIVSTNFAQMDGEQYQSSRREKRNLLFDIGFKPNYASNDVGSLRKQLNNFLRPKSIVQFRFFQTGEPVMEIFGMVETFDSPRFTSDPKAVSSIICFDPDFYDPTPVVISGNTTSTTTETPHDYVGTVDTGFTFSLLADRTVDEFIIYNRPQDNVLRPLTFTLASPILSGDILKISTVAGNKYATLTRLGVDSSVLYGISPQSVWTGLYPGVNNLRVYAEGAAVPYTIEYTTKFGAL